MSGSQRQLVVKKLCRGSRAKNLNVFGLLVSRYFTFFQNGRLYPWQVILNCNAFKLPYLHLVTSTSHSLWYLTIPGGRVPEAG